MAKPDNKPEIFEELKKLLQPYSKKLTVKGDSEKGYSLYHIGHYEMWGREFEELFFASTSIMKNFVGFYFFPIYTHPKKFELDPELKKMLKGKSCFHVKELTPQVKKKIAALLKEGYALYKKGKFVP